MNQTRGEVQTALQHQHVDFEQTAQQYDFFARERAEAAVAVSTAGLTVQKELDRDLLERLYHQQLAESRLS